jgi:hypothetical protein
MILNVADVFFISGGVLTFSFSQYTVAQLSLENENQMKHVRIINALE